MLVDDADDTIEWQSPCGKLKLKLKQDDAVNGYHPGQTDDDMAELAKVPYIAEQLSRLDATQVAEFLYECSMRSDKDANNPTANRHRLLWLICIDVNSIIEQ